MAKVEGAQGHGEESARGRRERRERRTRKGRERRGMMAMVGWRSVGKMGGGSGDGEDAKKFESCVRRVLLLLP